MPTFKCKCGFVSKESDDNDSDGILFSLDTFIKIQEKLAKTINDYYFLDEPEQKNSWLDSRFGVEYPKGLLTVDILEDIISSEFNHSEYKSTFCCPNCNRIAICENSEWSFYSKD